MKPPQFLRCLLPACDYLGERMASFFGITSAKYQYAIDEYYRMKKEVWPSAVSFPPYLTRLLS